MEDAPKITILDYTSTQPTPHFTRSLGLWSAVAVNMTQICGIGPFITIPLVVGAMGGPQAILGWIAGAILAITDGLVWAELGAAMPGAGGTYLYLREAFQYRTGKLMPFLFIWTIMLAIPLCMSTGVIGLVEYVGYYFPHMGLNWRHLISVGVTALAVIALYRNISSIAVMTNVMFVIMLITVGAVIVASFSHFDPKLAFAFPPGAFHLGRPFFEGLGAGLLLAVYDYAGYNTTAYMADELRDPGRILPRSIIYSIVAMMVIYLLMNVGVLGVIPWQSVAKSTYIGSDVLEQIWGKPVARIFTGLIVITAFASVFTGLLGGSRVPYNAARDKLFLPIFGQLHPQLKFPHVALLVMGGVTAICTFFDLPTVINMLVAVTVLVQSIAQIAAVTVLRRRQPTLRRPYRMFAYPLPSLVALVGWIYVYYASGRMVILLSLGWVGLGVIAFLIWAMVEKTWPFGAKEIREEFLTVDYPA
jgi:amino acid transporter